MARQLISKQIKLSLPAYIGRISYCAGILRFRQYKEFVVTQEQDIVIENISVEKIFSGTAVDVVGSIGQFDFVIYFTHPGRYVPPELSDPDNKNCGVIEVRLDNLYESFIAAKSENKTYDEILSRFLSDDKASKNWIYHPRFAAKEQQIVRELGEFEKGGVQFGKSGHAEPRQSTETPISSRSDFIDAERQNMRMAKFKCVICNVGWQGPEAGGNICPNCKSHLYSRVIATE